VHVVLLGFSAIIGLSLLLVQVLGERSPVLSPDSRLTPYSYSNSSGPHGPECPFTSGMKNGKLLY